MTFRGTSLSILLSALTLLGSGSIAKAGELAEQAAFTIGKTLCALKISNARPEEKSELVELTFVELKASQPTFKNLTVKPFLTNTGFLFKVIDSQDEVMAAVNCANGYAASANTSVSPQINLKQPAKTHSQDREANAAQYASDGMTSFDCLLTLRDSTQIVGEGGNGVTLKFVMETTVRGLEGEPIRMMNFTVSGSDPLVVKKTNMLGRLNWSEKFEVTGQPVTYNKTVIIDNGQGTSILIPLEINNYDGSVKDLRCPQNHLK